MKRQLVVISAEGSTRKVTLTDTAVSLGRANSNQLCYPEESRLSRSHAVFERAEHGWVVRDLGSRNGTFVNGQRLEGSRALENGSAIVAAHLQIRYEELKDADSESVSFESEGLSMFGEITRVAKLEDLLATDEPARTVRKWTPITALLKIGRELATPRPLHELFEIVLDLAIDVVDCERGVLFTCEGEDLVVRARRGNEFRISKGVRDRVINEKISLVIRDILIDPDWKAHESIVSEGIRSLVAVPLQTDDTVIGMLYLDSGCAEGISDEDLEMLTVMANVAAMRIERERLAEVEKAKQFLENELQQAADIQKQCLPEGSPAVRGFDIAGYSEPCRTVGGDYFGYFPLDDDTVWVIIADVAGKGMPASLLVMNFQARVQVLAQDDLDPATMAARLNDTLCSVCPANRFITAFVCRMDGISGEIQYCNAGHERPLLVRGDGTVEGLGVGGPIVGMFPLMAFEVGTARMSPGDSLVMFTDGVSEAQGANGDEFGTERLAGLFKERGDADAETMVVRVVESVQGWLAGEPAHDDVTLVSVVKKN